MQKCGKNMENIETNISTTLSKYKIRTWTKIFENCTEIKINQSISTKSTGNTTVSF